LDDVGDVNAPAPADGDLLQWDAGTSTWIPVAPSGGGASDLLARVVVAGTAASNVNPDPVVPTVVPGMTLSLTLAALTTVMIHFWLEFTSTGGGSRFAIYKDATRIWPEWGSGGNTEIAWFEDSGDGAGYMLGVGRCIVQLAAGTYTIEVRESASGSTNGKTYYGRLLEVRDVS
jgi:hypothetical protein